jgi:hypothetical protein
MTMVYIKSQLYSGMLDELRVSKSNQKELISIKPNNQWYKTWVKVRN